jgi:hypothetical protein
MGEVMTAHVFLFEDLKGRMKEERRVCRMGEVMTAHVFLFEDLKGRDLLGLTLGLKN